jgi:rapamycin-insensitive companion of mTOR
VAEQHIRLYATKHLGQLIRDTPKANEWTLRLLLTQLYDPAIQVAELAVHFLEDVCDDAEILELVVKMQPTLDHLGDIGHPLLLKYVPSSIARP